GLARAKAPDRIGEEGEAREPARGVERGQVREHQIVPELLAARDPFVVVEEVATAMEHEAVLVELEPLARLEVRAEGVRRRPEPWSTSGSSWTSIPLGWWDEWPCTTSTPPSVSR